MFGKSDQSIISSHFQQAEVYAGDDEISRAAFYGKDAKSFMWDMGYKNAPTQVISYEKVKMDRLPSPCGMLSVDLGGRCDLPEKVTYVPKNYQESKRKTIGNTLSIHSTNCTEIVSRQELTYKAPVPSSKLSEVGRFINAVFGGNLNYRKVAPCIPNHSLISQFKKMNP